MATFVVSTHFDETFDGGDLAAETADDEALSLREAIGLANAEGGENRIVFQAGLESLIRLTQGTEIEITSDLTIEGENRITISGDEIGNDKDPISEEFAGDVSSVYADYLERLTDNTRIFNISSGGDVVLDGLTLTGGRADSTTNSGGAIRVSDNAGAADRASVTINNSTIAGNITDEAGIVRGAAVYGIYADITITNSDVSYNRAGDSGGAISSFYGDLTITNTTMTENDAIGGSSGGGAIYAYNSNVTINHATITGNTADGEGGAIDARYGELNIANSIILGNNRDGAYDEIFFGNGGEPVNFTSLNIVGGDTAAFDASTYAGTVINAGAQDVFSIRVGNFFGVAKLNDSPVRTVALAERGFNPALDAAGISPTATDARGVAAFDQPNVATPPGLGVNAFRDLGAYELTGVVEANSLIVTTTDDVVNTTDGETSLREAVAYANTKEGADTITFAPSGQGLIRLTRGEIDITDELTIQGGGMVTITGDAGADDVTLAGGITDVAASGADLLDDNSRIFNASADLTIDGLTLTGGRTTSDFESGGAVYARDVTIIDSTFSGNSTAGSRADGGGLATFESAEITRSSFSGNSTSGPSADGGGL